MDENKEPTDAPAASEVPMTRVVAMPGDGNPLGVVAGGWLISRMDEAGGAAAYLRAKGPVATVAIDAVTFPNPMMVGDMLSCYCDVERVGETSMGIRITAWAHRRLKLGLMQKVCEGLFTFVAIDAKGNSRPVPPEEG